AYPLVESSSAQRFNEHMNSAGSDQLVGDRQVHLWDIASRASDDIDSDGNAPKANTQATEFQIGFGYQGGPDAVIGVAAGHGKSDIGIGSRFASGDVKTTSVGAYFHFGAGEFYAAGQATYNWHSVDSRRTLLAGGEARGSFHARSFVAGGEVGMSTMLGGYTIEPHISVKYATTHQDAFSEGGPAGALD